MEENNKRTTSEELPTSNFNSEQPLDHSPAFEIQENVIPITMDEYIAENMADATAEALSDMFSNKVHSLCCLFNITATNISL